MTTGPEALLAMVPPRAPVKIERLDVENAFTYLHDLKGWVDWLIVRYGYGGKIVPCWYRHGALVEELSALFTAWDSCFHPSSPGTAPIQWHRELEYCIIRIFEFTKMTGCTVQTHNESRKVAWLNEEYDNAFTEHVDEVVQKIGMEAMAAAEEVMADRM